MKSPPSQSSDNLPNDNTLRHKAEDLLNSSASSGERSSQPLSEAEALKLINELQVHQIELEMQNEELNLIKEQIAKDATKYAELYDFAPTGYFTLSEIGEILNLNLCGANMLGKARTGLINSRFGFFVSDDTKQIFNHFLDQVLISNEKETCQVTLSKDDQLPMYVQLVGIANHHEKQCLITAVDISANKQAEEALRISEERFSTIFRSSPDAISISNLKSGRIIDVSPAFNSLFGLSREQVIGKSTMELGVWVNPDERDRLMELVNSQGTVTGFTTRIKTASGTIRDLLLSTNLFTLANEECLLVMGRDITNIRQMEESLQARELSFREVLENSLDASYKRNLHTSNYEYLSPVFDQITGYTPEEFSNFPIDTVLGLMHPDDVPEVNRVHAKALSDPTCNDNHVEYRMKHKVSGEYRWLHDQFRVLRDAGGQPVSLIGSVGDITERKQAQNEIQLFNKQLIKINADKNKLFSIIAHDLRSPFNGFLGFTDLLVKDLDTFTQDEIRKIAARMRFSATNLFYLLENLLQWSRIQQGLIPFNREVIQLLPVVNESVSTIVESAKNKEIEIRYDIPERLTIFADINMLLSVIRNLTSNAVKFTPKGGNIMIFSKDTRDNQVEISIKDSGIGMSRSIVDNLFQIDGQTSRNGTQGEPSTGLGLILCKDFIEKHGGKIWVESEEGKGSTFFLTLPNKNALSIK